MILLRQVFQLMDKHKLKIKRSKCTFVKDRLTYLGHVISTKGVATNEKNVQAVRDWPRPPNVKEVRGFLGLVGYYHKFVRNFGLMRKTLN